MLTVHHIGYAVADLKQSLEMFIKLGYTIIGEPINDEKRNVEIAFVQNNGYLVELISPLNDKSPIRNYLNKIGNTPYHLCYETDNMDEAIAELRKQRYLLVEKPSAAIAIDDHRVAFLYHPKYGLLELLETGNSSEA
ncbi:MAG: VOC family protein [bacterium]|jgi:methylmalonyl-CoA/ethylmalonyl-CoA epimerase